METTLAHSNSASASETQLSEQSNPAPEVCSRAPSAARTGTYETAGHRSSMYEKSSTADSANSDQMAQSLDDEFLYPL